MGATGSAGAEDSARGQLSSPGRRTRHRYASGGTNFGMCCGQFQSQELTVTRLLVAHGWGKHYFVGRQVWFGIGWDSTRHRHDPGPKIIST